MSAITLASHIKRTMRLLAIKHRDSWKLTVPTVQEFSDDSSTAGGPGVGAVDLNESGRHHVVVLQFPKHVLTGPHIVVWHVEHVSCREEMNCQMSLMNTDICDTIRNSTVLMCIEWCMVLAHQAREQW